MVIIMLSALLMLGLAVKVLKDHYYTGTENLTFIGTNDKIVDYYAGLDEKDIEFAGMVNINSAGIEELITLLGIREKTTEKIIIKRNELGRFNSEEDIMLVPGIEIKTFEKLLPHKYVLESLDKPMCEEKRIKICLIKAGNAVNNCVMNKFSNENQASYGLFNLCIRFFNGFY